MTRTIFFDFGNVIAFFDHRRAVEQLVRHTDLKADQMLPLYGEKLVHDYETGRLTTDEFVRAVAGHWRLTCTPDEFLTHFCDIFWRNDEVLSSTATAPELTVAAPAGDAAYRVEIRASDRPDAPLWLVGNPLYVRTASRAAAAAGEASPAANRQPDGLVLFDTERSGEWRTEASPASKAALDVTRTVDGRALLLRYGLPRGEAFGEYAAAVVGSV